MNRAWSCGEFEAALSDYREGTLAPEAAALARQHVQECEACTRLLAQVNAAVEALSALPELPLPAQFEEAVFSRTRRPGRGRDWTAWMHVGRGGLPRLAWGMALTIFFVGMVADAAQVNVRRLQWSQLTPSGMTATVEAEFERTLARGVSFYQDLRVVYEIQAALHQMRQESAPPPPGGHSFRDNHGFATTPVEQVAGRLEASAHHERAL